MVLHDGFFRVSFIPSNRRFLDVRNVEIMISQGAPMVLRSSSRALIRPSRSASPLSTGETKNHAPQTSNLTVDQIVSGSRENADASPCGSIQAQCEPHWPKIILFDLETTGSSHHDRAIELALGEHHRDGRFTPLFAARFKTNRKITKLASDIHGIYRRHLKNEKPFAYYAAKIMRLIRGNILVAHNASFDERMMNGELKRLNPENPQALDSYVLGLACSRNIAREVVPELKGNGGYSLDALCDYFAIDRSSRIDPVTGKPLHGALVDIELQSRVIRALEKRHRATSQGRTGRAANEPFMNAVTFFEAMSAESPLSVALGV